LGLLKVKRILTRPEERKIRRPEKDVKGDRNLSQRRRRKEERGFDHVFKSYGEESKEA